MLHDNGLEPRLGLELVTREQKGLDFFGPKKPQPPTARPQSGPSPLYDKGIPAPALSGPFPPRPSKALGALPALYTASMHSAYVYFTVFFHLCLNLRLCTMNILLHWGCYKYTNGAPFMPFSAQALKSPRGPWPFLLFTGNKSGAGAWLGDQVVASRQVEATTGSQDWAGSQAVSTRQVVAGA